MTAAVRAMVPATVKVAMKVRVKVMMTVKMTAIMTARKERNKNEIKRMERMERACSLTFCTKYTSARCWRQDPINC